MSICGADETKLLRAMMLIRIFEEELMKRRDHGFQLLSSGQEAVAVGVCAVLSKQDQLLTSGRSIGPALARGLNPGKRDGGTSGKGHGTKSRPGGPRALGASVGGIFRRSCRRRWQSNNRCGRRARVPA